MRGPTIITTTYDIKVILGIGIRTGTGQLPWLPLTSNRRRPDGLSMLVNPAMPGVARLGDVPCLLRQIRAALLQRLLAGDGAPRHQRPKRSSFFDGLTCPRPGTPPHTIDSTRTVNQLAQSALPAALHRSQARRIWSMTLVAFSASSRSRNVMARRQPSPAFAFALMSGDRSEYSK